MCKRHGLITLDYILLYTVSSLALISAHCKEESRRRRRKRQQSKFFWRRQRERAERTYVQSYTHLVDDHEVSLRTRKNVIPPFAVHHRGWDERERCYQLFPFELTGGNWRPNDSQLRLSLCYYRLDSLLVTSTKRPFSWYCENDLFNDVFCLKLYKAATLF